MGSMQLNTYIKHFCAAYSVFDRRLVLNIALKPIVKPHTDFVLTYTCAYEWDTAVSRGGGTASLQQWITF